MASLVRESTPQKRAGKGPSISLRRDVASSRNNHASLECVLIDENLLVPQTSDVGWEVSIEGEELRLTETDSEYVQSRVDGVMDKCACLGTMLFDRMRSRVTSLLFHV